MRAAIEAWYGRLLELSGLVAGIVIALMALLISVDVTIRFLGIGTFPWLVELTEYGIYGITFFAAPWVLAKGAHVRVDVVLMSVPRPVAQAMEVVVDLAGAAISLVFLYYALAAARDAYATDSLLIKSLVIPEWWLLAVIPGSCALLTVEFLLRLRRTLRGDSVAAVGPEDRAAL